MDIVLEHVLMWKSWCTFFAGTCQSSDDDVIGWEFLLTKPINFGVNGKNISCWSKFAIKSIADFCLILGYWPSKNASSDHGINDGFVSLAKPTTLCTTGKIILCWPIFAKEPIADFCPFLGYWQFKEWLVWPWCKGWISFSLKTYRMCYHWKEKKLCWLTFSKTKIVISIRWGLKLNFIGTTSF